MICARKTTWCSFSDTAGCFSCVHAVRCRSTRRGGASAKSLPAGAKDDTGVDAARSQLPIPFYNCPKSVTVDARVCQLMREGKALVVEAPKICPTCDTAPDPATISSEDGEIMCSLGCCAMELQSTMCSSPQCQQRVNPDGREVGVDLRICATAGTAAVLRDMAREMGTSGSTFGACYRRWYNRYLDLRGAECFPNKVKLRSRQTIISLFFLAERLMCKDSPI